jgi:hypothetical protein
MRHYQPDTPPADGPVTANRTPLLRPWRSDAPASLHLIEQFALFWLDDDRRELDRLLPDAPRRITDALADEFDD